MSHDPVHSLLEKGRESFAYSAYQVWAEKNSKPRQWVGGITSYWNSQPVTEQTYFDIGSVTKAIVTTSLCARAVDAGKLDLDARCGDYLQAFRGGRLGDLVICDLLSHASGLVGWAPIYASLGKLGLREWLVKQGEAIFQAKARQRTEYSDLGFLILGEVVQAIFQSDLLTAWQNQVQEPLQLKQVSYGPLGAGLSIAATEYRGSAPLVGSVFDENSHALGGKTAHAGLFAPAQELASFCREWLRACHGDSTWLSQATAEKFTRPSLLVKDSSWALGWDTKSKVASSAGTRLGSASFGHLGYPGCSIWLDPHAQAFVIFHTNRVHPSRLDERIRKIRPQLHDAVWGLWMGEK